MARLHHFGSSHVHDTLSLTHEFEWCDVVKCGVMCGPWYVRHAKRTVMRLMGQLARRSAFVVLF